MQIKKKLSRLFLKWAKSLDPCYEYVNESAVRQMGITLHITKKDVRDWRKSHPECKSHRHGLKSLIEEAKWRVAGAIGRGLIEKGSILFDVKSTLYVADVSGIVFVYAPKEETAAESSGD